MKHEQRNNTIVFYFATRDVAVRVVRISFLTAVRGCVALRPSAPAVVAMEPVSAEAVIDLAELVLPSLPAEHQQGLSSVIDLVRCGVARPSILTQLVKDLKGEVLGGSAQASMTSTGLSGSLDDDVVSSHGYSTMQAGELIRLASTPESRQRSMDRVAEPPRAAKRLLSEINESRDFWKALRKHGTVQQCQRWLETMVANSTWSEVRDTEAELLRKEYLRLWDECKFYDPDFVDEEMKDRQRAAGVIDVSQKGGGKGGKGGKPSSSSV